MPTCYGKSYTQPVLAERQYARDRPHFTAWGATDTQSQAVLAWTSLFRQASANFPLGSSRKNSLRRGVQGVLIISHEENGTALLALRHPKNGTAQRECRLPNTWVGEPRSDLGKRLKAIQQQAATSGVKLSSNAEILDELRKGREHPRDPILLN